MNGVSMFLMYIMTAQLLIYSIVILFLVFKLMKLKKCNRGIRVVFFFSLLCYSGFLIGSYIFSLLFFLLYKIDLWEQSFWMTSSSISFLAFCCQMVMNFLEVIKKLKITEPEEQLSLRSIFYK